ncbi:MAG: O-antigen ligase family protein [Planctomycetota bacterium]|nr:O-antigen ligase family protein [Planctomycetota bacterium]
MKGLIFTYLVTGGGAAASLFNPFYGLLAYAMFAIIRPVDMWPWAVPEGRYSLILGASMIIGSLYSRDVSFRLGKSSYVLGILLAYLAWCTFRAFGSPDQQLAWDYVDILFKIALPFTIGLLTINSVDRLKQLAWTLAIAQGYVAWEINSYYWGGYNLIRYEGFGGMDNNSAAIGMVTGVGIAFFLAFHSEKTWQKGLAGFLTLLMGHAVLISFSRGGMLGAIIAGIATVIVIPKRPRTYFLMFAVSLFGAYLAGDEVRNRFMTIFVEEDGLREASAQSRLDLWKDCWDVMLKKPVMGLGPNHWPLTASDYGWPHGKEAHSLWVQAGAELGFTGLFLLAGFYFTCICQLWTLTWKSTPVRDEWHRATARMAIVGLCGFMVSASFVSLESLEIPYYTVLLGCGAIKLATQWRKPSEADLLNPACAGEPAYHPDPPFPGLAHA